MLPMKSKIITSLEVWAYLSVYYARENSGKILDEVKLVSLLASSQLYKNVLNITSLNMGVQKTWFSLIILKIY